jgi:voltage-gated potassium channel
MKQKNDYATWRQKLHEVIFESDTPAGKLFDVLLLIAIVLSVIVVMLESVRSIALTYGKQLHTLEWIFTILFTIEYFARIISFRHPKAYISSPLGIIDLMAILPTYLSIFISGAQTLIVIRTLRLLRVFRILKLVHFVGEANLISKALLASRAKIIVFLVAVVSLVVIFGTIMYLVEPYESGFTSIPQSIYWCIVTMTTVGYGDITPTTVLGKTIASLIMIMGYGIIAVPTGIVTAEMTSLKKSDIISTQVCANCSREGHDPDARYCKYCGFNL